jgi:hypothetical protein
VIGSCIYLPVQLAGQAYSHSSAARQNTNLISQRFYSFAIKIINI